MNLNPKIKRWLFTTYHKDVGILYFVTALIFGAVGAILAEGIRIQLSGPNNQFLSDILYLQFVTMHGLVMILWFLSPLGIAFANYFVPLQIGADDLAYPRLNAMSYWMYLFGGMIATIGFILPGIGTASGGWTSYAPLSSQQYSLGAGTTLTFAGLAMLITSVTLGSVNFLVTIFTMRAPGLTWKKLPMFTWFMLFTIALMLFAFPTLLAAAVMLISDRVLGTSIFFSSSGGAILWDNLFWAFGHPEVYVVLLPGFGALAEILPVFSRRLLAGKNFILVATAIGVVPLSAAVWGHHMFLTTMSVSTQQTFSVTTILISIPFDLIILSFVRTPAHGIVRFKTPMLFAIGSLILFIVGGITGVFLSSFVLDRALRGDYFVVAHFHYVMVGATIFALFGAIYYWLPKMTGKMYHEDLGKIHFLYSFVGFNVLYFPMFFLLNMPRRIPSYASEPGWSNLNLLASIGGTIFILAQLLLIVNLIYTLRKGTAASSNPWGSLSPEWEVGAKPEAGPYLYDGAVSSSSATAHAYVGPHLSSRPITLCLGLTITLFGTSFFLPAIAPQPSPTINFIRIASLLYGLIILAWAIIAWMRDDLHGKFSIPEMPEAEKWPFEHIPKLTLGMWIFLASDIIFFGSLIGGYLFIRAGATFPRPGSIHDPLTGTVMTILLLISSFAIVRSILAIRKGDQTWLFRWLFITFLLGAGFLIIEANEWYDLFGMGFWFTTGLPGSTFFLITGIHGAHVATGLIILIYLMKKTLNGGFTKEDPRTVEGFGLYWHFVDVVWVFLFPLFFLV